MGRKGPSSICAGFLSLPVEPNVRGRPLRQFQAVFLVGPAVVRSDDLGVGVFDPSYFEALSQRDLHKKTKYRGLSASLKNGDPIDELGPSVKEFKLMKPPKAGANRCGPFASWKPRWSQLSLSLSPRLIGEGRGSAKEPKTSVWSGGRGWKRKGRKLPPRNQRKTSYHARNIAKTACHQDSGSALCFSYQKRKMPRTSSFEKFRRSFHKAPNDQSCANHAHTAPRTRTRTPRTRRSPRRSTNATSFTVHRLVREKRRGSAQMDGLEVLRVRDRCEPQRRGRAVGARSKGVG